MNNDFKLILEQLMNVKKLNVFFIDKNTEDISFFDGGFRVHIFKKYSFDAVLEWMKNVKSYTLFHMQDTFYLHFDLCKIPNESTNSDELFIIGPYLLSSDPVDISHIVIRNNLQLYSFSELQNFYSTVTLIDDLDSLENELLVLLRFFYPNNDFTLNTKNTVDFYNNITDTQVNFNYDNPFSINKIEKLYQKEDELLSAIRNGDYTQAFEAMHSLSNVQVPKKFDDEFQNYKHYVTIHNSLFRKEVQKANVHPAYIDKISNSFTDRIEKSTNKNNLMKIYHDMLRKYCLIVQNQSLDGYSKIVQNTINYINFHLSEDLSLKSIALNIKNSPNYLSSQFKREVGKTLTEYVNEKRIEKSLLLLTTTDMQIQEISEKVGINDENYFSRLFKKKYHITASEYRKKMKETKS